MLVSTLRIEPSRVSIKFDYCHTDFLLPQKKRIFAVGGTFMAAAASSSELFINVVGTFVTKSDLGVGTIVGSAVFNILAVPSCCGLFARKVSAFRQFNFEEWSEKYRFFSDRLFRLVANIP